MDTWCAGAGRGRRKEEDKVGREWVEE